MLLSPKEELKEQPLLASKVRNWYIANPRFYDNISQDMNQGKHSSTE